MSAQACFVILGVPGSTIGRDVAAELTSRGEKAHALSLDAPLEGRAVTIRDDGVQWEGVPLCSASAILLECPVFPWPNRIDREARALIGSAIRVVAADVPVIDPPAAAHLAASPAIALDRLAAAGLALHPFRLGPAPAPAPSPTATALLVLDAAGRERWHTPRCPAPGEPALLLDPLAGPVLSLLVIGREPVGALRFASGAAWLQTAHAGPEDARTQQHIGGQDKAGASMIAPEDLAEGAVDLARRAAAALDLDLLAITVAAGASPRLVFAEAGPDLRAWNLSLGGRVVSALADLLVARAREQKGVGV